MSDCCNFPVSILGGGRTDPVLFDADFSRLSLGGHSAATFASEMAAQPHGRALIFARSSDSSIQTSPATVLTPSTTSLGNDVACIGDQTSGDARGLQVQPKTNNIITAGTRDLSGAFWTPNPPVTPIANTLACPDGRTDRGSRIGTTGLQASPYYTDGAGHHWCLSSWQRSATGATVMQQASKDAGNPPVQGQAITRAASTAWGRIVTRGGQEYGTIAKYHVPVHGGDLTAIGGTNAASIDAIVDMLQVQRGGFATSFIETAGATQQDDRLSWSLGNDLLDAGVLNVRFVFFPLFDSSDTVYDSVTSEINPFTFLDHAVAAAHDSVRIFDHRDATYPLCLNIRNRDTTQWQSTVSMSWSQNDRVEVHLRAGAGAVTARYRKNARGAALGSWVDLSAGAGTPSAFSFPNAINLMWGGTDDTGTMPCFLQRITAYRKDATGPA